MGISEKIQGKEIYLDANIFIYLLEGYAEFIPLLTQLFGLIDEGVLRGVTSELTIAESLVKPMINKNLALQQIYKNTIQTSATLEVTPVTRDILIAAAALRAEFGNANTIRLPDAIHLATAQSMHCKFFLTNDKKLKNIPGIKVLLISEIKASTLVAE